MDLSSMTPPDTTMMTPPDMTMMTPPDTTMMTPPDTTMMTPPDTTMMTPPDTMMDTDATMDPETTMDPDEIEDPDVIEETEPTPEVLLPPVNEPIYIPEDTYLTALYCLLAFVFILGAGVDFPLVKPIQEMLKARDNMNAALAILYSLVATVHLAYYHMPLQKMSQSYVKLGVAALIILMLSFVSYRKLSPPGPGGNVVRMVDPIGMPV